MQQALDTLRNAPPYLLGLLGFVSALAWGLIELTQMLRAAGL